MNIQKILLSIVTVLILISPLKQSYAETQTYRTKQGKVHIVPAGIDTQQNKVKFSIHYELAPGWKIYWRTPGDAGTPTEISFLKGSQNIKNPTLYWPAPKRHIDQISDEFTLTSYIYEDEVAIPVTAEIPDVNAPVNANLELSFSICKDICIPYKTTFNINFPYIVSTENIALFDRYLAKVPHNESKETKIKVENIQFLENDSTLFLHIKAKQTNTEFNAFTSDIFIENLPSYTTSPPKIILSNNKKEANFYIPLTPTIPGKHNKKLLNNSPITITLLSGSSSLETTKSNIKIVKSNFSLDNPYSNHSNIPSIWIMIVYALIGGFILNLMPCVLPVLSIKIMGLLNHSGGNNKQARNSLITTASGIVFSFIVLAMLTILLKYTGETVGWGIHFQQPVFIITLIIIMTLFALNMLGRYEINLPEKLTSKILSTETQTSPNSPVSNFLMGAFATLLATPCSAPFLGTAVSFALSQTSATILLIFIFMGIGMAMPYLFFSLFPNLITNLPKPGAWMETIRKILAIMLIATAFWLLWVLAGQLGTVPAIITGLFCLLIKFTIEKEKGWLSTKRSKVISTTILIILTFITPMSFSNHMEQQKVRIDNIWQPFEESAIADHITQGHIVVVDVTADWCTTCQANKFLVLNRNYILDILAQPNVIAMRLDLTNPNPIGYEFLKKHDRYGIPFNIIYGPKAPNGVKLPVLLTSTRIKTALKQAGL